MVYWLREQAVNFVLLLQKSQIQFTVVKHFQNPRDASDLMKHIIASEKSRKLPHTSKFEYFYVIANHGFSGWHLHILSNRKLEAAQYSKPVEKQKASGLYLVKNLALSRFADYEGVRRYGGSSLLYKQNKKTSFKTRMKLWRLKVSLALCQSVLWLALMTMAYSVKWVATPALFDDLRYVQITQPLRNHRGITEELVFRKPRDDLIGEWGSG